jgi:hypothetical protein
MVAVVFLAHGDVRQLRSLRPRNGTVLAVLLVASLSVAAAVSCWS